MDPPHNDDPTQPKLQPLLNQTKPAATAFAPALEWGEMGGFSTESLEKNLPAHGIQPLTPLCPWYHPGSGIHLGNSVTQGEALNSYQAHGGDKDEREISRMGSTGFYSSGKARN